MFNLPSSIARRSFLKRSGVGLGSMALGSLLAQEGRGGETSVPKWDGVIHPLHHAPKAKRIIWLYMAGGMTHLETFDHKPKLAELNGQPIPQSYIEGKRFAFMDSSHGTKLLGTRREFKQHGQSGRWVSNLFPHTARIVDDGRVTFQTRAVIGKNVPDQRTPEFSDEMEYMVVNPSWGVPRSIIVKEYLPLLQRNPNAVSHLQVVDGRGRVVPRGAVNFAAYSARSFPFGLRQPPSDGNALGKVKFMFPNTNNIYLHDTPAKNLFAHEVRAYSHGCIRLGDPFDFAYTLLAAQTDDPKGVFKHELDSDRESNVALDQHVPVHLVYFTAWPTARGTIGYRNDIYGRDAAIFEALTEAGVVLPGVQG